MFIHFQHQACTSVGASVVRRHLGSLLLGAMTMACAGCWAVSRPGTDGDTPTLGGEFLPGTGGDPRGEPVIPPADTGDPSVTLSIAAEPAFCCDSRTLDFAAELSDTAKSTGAVYEWEFGDQRSGSGAEITHVYSWPGSYVVALTVTLADGSVFEAVRTVTFAPDDVPDGTDPPPDPEPEPEPDVEVFANAGNDLQVASAAAVVLDGRRSSGTGDEPLRYEWRQVRGPAVDLQNRFSVAASFTAPEILGDPVTLSFALVVTQGDVSDVDDLNVVVSVPEPTIPVAPPIRFALTDEDGNFIRVTQLGGASSAELQRFFGSWGEAEIRKLSEVEYELSLTLAQNVENVWFPWFPSEYACERILYPHLMGLQIDNHRLSPGVWSDKDIAVYPGQTVMPGAIMENSGVALGVYATNWPPLEVNVLYARGTVALRYDGFVGAGQIRRYRAMVVDAAGAGSVEPWHQAMHPYKDWLRANMLADGLLPIAYPDWMLAAHGWSNVQLEDYDDPVAEVRHRWENWGHVFPAIQTWGSMSNRHPTPGEQTGCCLIDTSLHPRNAEIPALAAEVVAGGGQFGYYARPRDTGPVAGPVPVADANREFLLDWIDVHRNERGANMNYLDWFIVRPLGPVIDIAFQFRDGLWGFDTVCERAVDVYPTAYLMSGALWGGPRFRTFAEQTLDDLPVGQTGIAFPRLVRYLLDDRVIFLGESNGDHSMWGTRRGQDFWGERQAFLLGCKLDWMQRPDGSGPEDPAVPEIIDAWTRSGFWARSPVYRDTIGVTGVPASSEVTRFMGSTGETILAVVTDLPDRSLSFEVDGVTRSVVPRARYDIFVLDE